MNGEMSRKLTAPSIFTSPRNPSKGWFASQFFIERRLSEHAVDVRGGDLAAIVEHHGVVGTDEAEGKQLHEKGGHLKGGPQ